MRRLLTGGIKAILAIAALSTAAHWTLRVQRDPAPAPVVAALAEPATTGSIPARVPPVRAEAPARGLDQDHLSALIASTTAEKPKAARAVARR